MPVSNAEISDLFARYATLLEIQGANPFRVRAYRQAARMLQSLPQSVAEMLDAGADLAELPGIGRDLAGKIAGIVASGTFAALSDLEHEVPAALAELAAIPGLGPKRVQALHKGLGIDTVRELREAARAGRIRALPGLGAKTEARILHELDRHAEAATRFRLDVAEQIAGPLLRHLRRMRGVKEAVVAGSFRRRRETVGDLDILVAAAAGAAAKVMERFVGYDDVDEVLAHGRTRSTVRLRTGMQVDLRLVPEASYGAALLYFTGSKAHNIAVRAIAARKRLKLNEYGAFAGKKRVAGRSEEEVYARLGLPYIQPELREDRGEVAAARAGRLPDLVTMDAIRGDLHCHTDASDGAHSAREMAEAARKRGYDYLAITDHTKHVTVAHGLDEKRLARQIEEIDRLNEGLRGFRLLKSAEVDILEDGSLDLPDAILRQLDFTVCAIHYKLDLPREKQTERILRAMDNRHFTILAHPTGRLIGQREPSRLDMERIMAAALERGCFLEINSQPERLDLSDAHARMAKEMGLKIAISTDAHSTRTLDLMRYGVGQARRAWIEPDDVLNTRGRSELQALLRRG